MTREQKITLLHELVEHTVVHHGLRADLHEPVREITCDGAATLPSVGSVRCRTA
jgi:hypothetical protein